MINLNKKILSAAVCVALSQSALVSSAYAQDSGSSGKLDIEEVVVTGTKRSVAQQDLSVAVTTVTSKQLEATFQNDVTALTELAPNVNLTPQTGFRAIAGGMRGTGFNSILVTKDASVGITVDEFAFNNVQSQFIEMFDMEQVEIYRGPQGTVFGKNTTGGAIAFTTRKPVLGEFFGDIEGNFSQFASNDSNATKLKFSLNVPLGDTLAARLAVIQDKSDGWYTNDKPAGGEFQSLGCPFPGQPGSAECNDAARSKFPDVGNGEDLNGIDVLAGKLKFRWQPSDFYTADLTFEYVKDRSDTVAAANETPLADQNGGEGYLWPIAGFPGIGNGDPFSTGQSYTATRVVDIPGGHKIDADGIYLNQTFNFDKYEAKWIFGMRDQDEVLASTYTGEAYTSQYDASRNSQREMLQNEFRLASNYDGPFNFVTGAAYYEDDVDFLVYGNLGYFLIFSGPAAEFYRETYEIQVTQQDRESYAFYIDGSYDITDSLKLTAGFRRTEDEKDFTRLSLGTAANPISNFISEDQFIGPHTNPLPESAFGNVIKDNEDFSANTYRLVLDYQFSDDVMIYGSVATGFVAGGFSETCGSEFSCTPYASEENENYELGAKADLMDGTLRLNAALFHTTYENLQRDTVLPFKDAAGNDFQETVAVNEGESTAIGFELEMTYVPTPNFRIDMNFGWLDHEYDSYDPFYEPGTLGVAGDLQRFDFSSLEVPYSPEFNGGVSFTYFQDMASGSSLTYNLNMHYQDEAEINPAPASFQGGTLDNPILVAKANTQLEERTLVNAYITWASSEDAFEVSLYGKNLLDEEYRNSANPVANLWNFTTYGPPRELGLQVGYSF
ncbi:TonB-dependent receptor [Luminiphilus syltensis NOR5-1B]|uniref:TonB-dependent receptor n=1 Tax=Luminiphilus syltensis NOR5-1B TaxID=565045 RepID=B8KVI6_9GAMM|nr:TonB-dependent receptor [Luminiphilus syltensis]EED34370.1 TonB-dependent receptor [Luminiphilus syltensis NOR5-1B]